MNLSDNERFEKLSFMIDDVLKRHCERVYQEKPNNIALYGKILNRLFEPHIFKQIVQMYDDCVKKAIQTKTNQNVNLGIDDFILEISTFFCDMFEVQLCYAPDGGYLAHIQRTVDSIGDKIRKMRSYYHLHFCHTQDNLTTNITYISFNRSEPMLIPIDILTEVEKASINFE